MVFKNGDTLVIDVTDAQTENKPDVKITDGSGNVLYYNTSGKKATYSTFDNVAAAINGTLYQRSGTTYSIYTGGSYNVELLSPTVELKCVQTFTKANITVTFKTASKSSKDGLSFRGSETRATMLATNGSNAGAGGGCNRLVFQGSHSVYNFENIVLDGNNEESQEGGLIKVGERGGTVYYSDVYLKSGAVVQNGRTNHDDQGGGIYVGPGCKLYMESGSLIQNCRSAHSGASSGGAIYLAGGKFYCNGGVIKDCQSLGGAAVDLGGVIDKQRDDRARIYLFGTPKIIENISTENKAMNVHLNYDSNEIINVVGNMADDACVGISVNEDKTIFEKHGKEGKPFATVKDGVRVNPLSFVNDRDTSLSAMRSTTNGNLVIWYYPLTTDVVEDYYVDGQKLSTTTLVEKDVYKLDNTKDYTDAALAAEYQIIRNLSLSNGCAFDYIEILAHTDVCGDYHPAISHVTNLRFVDYGSHGGRRWEVSGDNGKSWEGVYGRRMVIHYRRDGRTIPVYYVKSVGSTLERIPDAELDLKDGNAISTYTVTDEKTNVKQASWLGDPSLAQSKGKDEKYYYAVGPADPAAKSPTGFFLSANKDEDLWFYNANDGIYFSSDGEQFQTRSLDAHNFALYIVYGERLHTVKVRKVWNDSGKQVDHSGDTVNIAISPNQGGVTVYSNQDLVNVTLTSADAAPGESNVWETDAQIPFAASYTVTEDPVKPGYSFTYSIETAEDGTPTVITVTNIRGVELPSTGGTGTYLYTIGGSAILAGGLLYGLQLRRRREGTAE